MVEKPNHVLRDAPVATSWWYEAALERIENAAPDELEGIAKEITPFGWGAIRKVRGGASAKRSWLTFCLSLSRCSAIRATNADWSDGKVYGKEEPDPISIYIPLVEAVLAENPEYTDEQVADKIMRQVGGEDWSDRERATAIAKEARNASREHP